MQGLIDVILPVFLVVGVGYAAAWRGIMSETSIDGLMKFALNIAIPALLFLAIARLDLAAVFDPALLVSFYVGAVAGFALGLVGARFLFGRGWEDAVAVGFVCLFSNSLMLGLPITERAYGAEALGPNYAIIAIHAPFCYAIGITAMEVVRASGSGALAGLVQVGRGLTSNPLIVALTLGAGVNLSGLGLPGAVWDALDLVARASLPAALFGLGGVLFRYRPEGDLRLIAWACMVSLVAHPAITWGLGNLFGLSTGQQRSAVVTAAMAPGVNAYLFADLYGRARRVAASTVLVGTAACAVTTWVWMSLLP